MSEKDSASFFETIMHREKLRLQYKGTKSFIASIIVAVTLLFGVIALGPILWPYVIKFIEVNQIEKWKFVIYSTWITNLIAILVANLLFTVLYKLQSPAVE